MAESDSKFELLSRKEATERGLKHYFSKNPCRQGHDAPRFVSSGTCTVCHLRNSIAQYRRNPGRERLRKRKWRENPKNKELHMQRMKRWMVNNPEKSREASRKRESRKKENGGKCGFYDVMNILIEQSGKCAYSQYNFSWCNPSFGADNVHHMDHIIPISHGGSNDPHNRQALCQPCNFRKGRKSEELFLRESGVFECSPVA